MSLPPLPRGQASSSLPYFEGLPSNFERAERLVAVGGTVTTLVALVHELEPYDSSFVHLRELSLDQVSAATERMSALDVAGLPHCQACGQTARA